MREASSSGCLKSTTCTRTLAAVVRVFARGVESGEAYLGLSVLTRDEEVSDNGQYTVKQVLLGEATVHRRVWAGLVQRPGPVLRMRTIAPLAHSSTRETRD